MALLTQTDIRSQYTKIWAELKKSATSGAPEFYGSRAEDAIVQPLYLDLLRDLHIPIGNTNGAAIDIGSGSGRWIQFLLEQLRPASLLGVDVTQESIDLLRSRAWAPSNTALDFKVADITSPTPDLPLASFDLVNIANVLFHIPEHDLYAQALANLRSLITPQGCILTTEYLPRTEMRTPWMLVRSRYNFEKLIAKADLKIADIRAFTVFNNDPMGIDGHDDGPRLLFNKVRHQFKLLENGSKDPQFRAFIDELQANIDRAVLAFCKERIADIDLPSQKLVALIPR